MAAPAEAAERVGKFAALALSFVEYSSMLISCCGSSGATILANNRVEGIMPFRLVFRGE